MINFMITQHVAVAETTDSLGMEANPPCLPDYQEFMLNMDLSDQQMSYYYVGRRSKK